MQHQYSPPAFLGQDCSPELYRKWLEQKTGKLYRRDTRNKRRKIPNTTRACYKKAIHEAVKKSEGKDAYTGKKLNWKLLGRYRNEKAKKEGKQKFKELPTVDHYSPKSGKLDFRICAWYVNDCKSDLTFKELLDFCKAILKYEKHHRRR